MSAVASMELVMPRMGLTMEEGTVVAWRKRVGETVQAGEPLVEIETDKTTVEIEAPASGVLQQIIAQPGETLPVGSVIGLLSHERRAASHEGKEIAEPGVAQALPPGAGVPGVSVPAAPQAVPALSAAQPDKVRASPAARRIAREKGLELTAVTGSGPGGRIVAWNVEQSVAQIRSLPDLAHSKEAAAPPKASPVAQRLADDLGVDLERVQGSGPGGRITRKDVERSQELEEAPARTGIALPTGFAFETAARLQRLIAERMTASFRDAPHFYLHSEVDCRALLALRQSLLPRLEERAHVHLTITDMLVKFCALILEKHPQVTAQWSGDGFLKSDAINIGIATDTPGGLLVPVIHSCEHLGLSEIALRRSELVEKARQGRLSPEELELGTFTISNLGMFQIDFFDAILNPPQAAILAVGRIKERPVVENGQLIPAHTMMLSLSVDHRVLDGVKAARFLSDLVEMIETPGLALG